MMQKSMQNVCMAMGMKQYCSVDRVYKDADDKFEKIVTSAPARQPSRVLSVRKAVTKSALLRCSAG